MVQAALYFWTKVQKTEGCWLWCGVLDRDGYGHFKSLVTGRKVTRCDDGGYIKGVDFRFFLESKPSKKRVTAFVSRIRNGLPFPRGDW
jgi:hypothetical protein